MPPPVTAFVLSAAIALSAAQAGATDQTTAVDVRFLPGGPGASPPLAHLHEPRLGVRKEIGSSRMKLDIGGSFDFLEVARGSSLRIRFGADFFAYALTTSSEGLRLQVDAVDGFFGGHILARFPGSPFPVDIRLRVMHLSAHFLDGHLLSNTTAWRDNRAPVPFTRDFGEVLAMVGVATGVLRWRVYTGVSYATLIRPVEIRRWTSLYGIECWSPEITGNVMGKPCNFYAAYHLTVSGIPSIAGSNNVEAGIRFGEWDESGIRVYLSYSAGPDLFSQYYDIRREFWGLGFAFDVR